jgi:hypothetical protein
VARPVEVEVAVQMLGSAALGFDDAQRHLDEENHQHDDQGERLLLCPLEHERT